MARNAHRHAPPTSIDLWDHDTNQRAIYQRAKIRPGELGTSYQLAAGCLGRYGVDRSWRGRRAVCFEPIANRIGVRPGLPDADEAWFIYPALAEWWLFHCPGSEQEKARAARELGACLRAPADAYVAAVETYGLDLASLGRAFRTSQLSAGLRWGEVTKQPTALVSKTSTRIRGEAFDFGDEDLLRAFALDDRRSLDGVRKLRVAGDKKRVLVLIDGYALAS